jgi:hypothetical protein
MHVGLLNQRRQRLLSQTARLPASRLLTTVLRGARFASGFPTPVYHLLGLQPRAGSSMTIAS